MRFDGVRSGKGPRTADGVPDRHDGRSQDNRRADRRPADQRRGDHKREHDVFDRVCSEAEQRTERELGDDERRSDERGELQDVVPLQSRSACQGEDRRRDNQRAERIAEPPVKPQRGKALPRLNASGTERCRADRGAHRGRRDDGDTREGQNVPDAPKAEVELWDTAKDRVARTASSVLPVASTNAVHSGAFVAALTAKAPSQIAGQSRGPQMRGSRWRCPWAPRPS